MIVSDFSAGKIGDNGRRQDAWQAERGRERGASRAFQPLRLQRQSQSLPCMPASYLYSVVKRVSKPPGFQFSLANVFMPRLCRWNKLQLQSKMLKVCSIYDYHQFSFYRPR